MPSPVDLCAIPAAKPPLGLQSNLVDPPSLAPVMMSVMGILVVWASLFVAARFYMNIYRLTWSDYFVIIALFESIAILGMTATQLHLARHMWDVPACAFNAAYIKFDVYFPAMMLMSGAFLAKASILLLFRQIFNIEKSMRPAIWVGMALNVIIYVPGLAVASYYEAPHPGEHWMNVLDGRTLKPLKWWQAQSMLTIVLDLYIFILPLPMLVKLQMPPKKLLQAVAVFSLALLGIGTSIASSVARFKIATTGDQTWIAAILELCSYVELNVAIIVGCAPSFAGYTRVHLPKVASFISSISGGSTIRSGDVDSEAGLVGSREKSGKASSSKSSSVIKHSSSVLSGKYYELEDPLNVQPGQIIRTVDVTQNVDGVFVKSERV